MAEIVWTPRDGVNTSDSSDTITPLECVRAQGIYFKDSSNEIFMKAGRAAYNPDAVGGVGDSVTGLLWAELTSLGSVSQILSMRGTTLVRSPVALTGSFTTVTTALSNSPLGLWATFATPRYYLNNGVDEQKTFYYDTVRADYIFRKSGLKPPTEQGTATLQPVGASSASRARLIVPAPDPAHDYTNESKINDTGSTGVVDTTTYGYGVILNKDNYVLYQHIGYGGTVGSDYSIAVTLESLVEGKGEGSTTIEYTTNGGGAWTTAFTIVNAATPTTYVVPFNGTSYDPINLGIRIRATKTNDRGKYISRPYDDVLFGGTFDTSYDVTSEITYAIAEYSEQNGIYSVAGPRFKTSTGTASGVKITLPTSPNNPVTTHYAVFRTNIGGAWPVASLVQLVPIGTPYVYDTTSLTGSASSVNYRIVTIGAIPYDADVEPPVATVCTTFQNVQVLAPVAEPWLIRYSLSGFPESFPEPNKVVMASNRDDTVMGLTTLGTMLGVFMKSRIRRIDHLPTPSDPSFSASPEDVANDHGVESREGLARFSLSGGKEDHVAYVARDGIRYTNLYQTTKASIDIDWEATVDVSRLSTSLLRNNPSKLRLEFTFDPAPELCMALGWSSTARGVMWLHYDATHPKESGTPFKITFHPILATAARTIPVNSTDYTIFMTADGHVWVDEVGDSDATNAYDASGTIPRLIESGRFYAVEISRRRLRRFYVDRAGTSGTPTVTITAGRDGDASQASRRFLWHLQRRGTREANMTGQWFQFKYEFNTNSGTPSPLVAIAAQVEEQVPWI